MGFNFFKKNTNKTGAQVAQRPVNNISVGKIIKYDDQEYRFYDILDIEKLTNADIASFKEVDMFSVAGHSYIPYSQFKNMLIQAGKIAPQSITDNNTNNTYDIVIKAYTETLNRFFNDITQAYGYGDAAKNALTAQLRNATIIALYNPENLNEEDRFNGFTNNNNARENLIRKTNPLTDIPKVIQQFLKSRGMDIEINYETFTEQQIVAFAQKITEEYLKYGNDLDIENEKLH